MGAPGRKPWRIGEEAVLIQQWNAGATVEQIADALPGRTAEAVRSRAVRLVAQKRANPRMDQRGGSSGKAKWSPADDRVLLAARNRGVPINDIVADLFPDRSRRGVTCRLFLLAQKGMRAQRPVREIEPDERDDEFAAFCAMAAKGSARLLAAMQRVVASA